MRGLTAEHGMIAGYVRGGRSRHLRPILMAGNMIAMDLRARTEDQLASMTAELLISRAPLLAQPLATAAMDWITSLTTTTLPESQPFPVLYEALAATLEAIAVAASARQWAAGLARYELLLLAELGFGLSLEHCVVTGADNGLSYVSPKSGAAVSEAAAAGFEHKLFRFPAFLRGEQRNPPMVDVMDALTLTGHFLDRDLLHGRTRDLGDVRLRLMDRLNRAVA